MDIATWVLPSKLQSSWFWTKFLNHWVASPYQFSYYCKYVILQYLIAILLWWLTKLNNFFQGFFFFGEFQILLVSYRSYCTYFVTKLLPNIFRSVSHDFPCWDKLAERNHLKGENFDSLSVLRQNFKQPRLVSTSSARAGLKFLIFLPLSLKITIHSFYY